MARSPTLRYRTDAHENQGALPGVHSAMTRVSVAERARLSALIGRRAFRGLLGALNTHPLLRWRFGSTKTDRLVIAPQDLRTADATRAAEIYAGRFAFAGKVVICDRRSPFEMTPPSDEWAAILLGFAWLRHLRAADSAITRANARSLIDDWITIQGSWHAGRLAAGNSVAPDHLLAQPVALHPAGRRCALLPPLHPQPVAPGALPAPQPRRMPRRHAAPAGA